MKNANSTFISSSFGLSWLRTSLNVAAFACASLLVITSLADAGGAQGARVRRGNVSFSQDGNRLIVRASNGAIIEYDRLSIEAGQIMQFIQPSSSSRVLNRVTGSQLTRIDGTLLSNGIVYLVNPQGFRIGNGAVINVGGFFAAAGAMSNSDFVAGRNRFTNLVGEVTNEGLIQAKSVALVGQYVANRGTIDVGDGYVAMGAGDKVFIQDGTGPVMVTVSRSQMGADGSGAGTKAAISNTGTIDAGEGSVTMANGDFYSLAMDLSGTIVGKSIAARGGKGGVLAVNGTLDASSSTGKGGTIDIFGDRVGLFGDALVNANGATGGGSVRIGGDYLGSNAANAPQASRTFIGDNARITANATQSGDGGRVIVWSNEYTGFFGTIEASAAASGKGGFIETSSHDNLQAFGSVDASSALGQAGTWLLDPSDVVISAGSAGSLSSGVFDPVGSPASIGVVEINAALDAGTSVIINTASAASGAGNITMTGAISKTAGGDATLTLNAVGTIVLSQSISSTTGALSVALNAGGSVTINSIISTNGGTLAIVAGDAVTQGGASTLTIGDTTTITAGAGNNISLDSVTNNFLGSVSIISGQDVTLRDSGGIDLASSTISGNLILTANGATSDSGVLQISGTATFTVGANSIILNNAGNDFGVVSIVSASTATLVVTNAITLGASNVTTLNLTFGTTLSQVGILTVGGATTLIGSALNADIGLASFANTLTGAVTIGGTASNIRDFSLRNINAAAGVVANLGAATTGLRDLSIIYDNASYVLPTLTGLPSLQNVSITANNLTIGAAFVASGAVAIASNSGVNIGLGNAAVGLDISNAELAFITAASLNITAGGAGTMTVNGVTTGGVITGITTLTAGGTGVTFNTAASAFDNALTVASAATIAGVNLTTVGDNVIFGSTVALTTAAVVITTDGGDLTFSAGISGAAFDLDLDAGAGGAITGTSVAINNLTITNGTSAAFIGNVTLNSLITTSSAYTLSMTGAANTITTDTIFLNTGAVTIGQVGGTSTFTGGLDTTAASGTNIAGIVETTNTQMDLGATTMSAASTLRSGSGAINVASLAGGANVLTLGSATQTGTVTFAGNAVAQGLTTFASAYNIAFNGTTNTFTNDTTFLNTGTVTLGNGAGDTSTFTGGLDTTAASGTNIAGIVETTNTQMDLGATTMTTAATLRSGSGAINVASLAGGANVLTLGSATQTGTVTFAGNAVAQGLTTFASAYNIAFNGTTNTFTNDTTFLNTGTVTLGNGVGDTSTFTGGLDTTAASGTNIAGIVETTNTQMDLGATTMTAASTLRSGNTAINVASLAGGANVLTLGSATQTGTVTFAGNAVAQGLTTFASAYNIAFNGTTNAFTNDTTFLNTGTVTLGNDAGDTSTFTGGLDTTAASGTNIAGVVETTNTQMDLGATTMTTAATLRSGSGAINVASLAGGANVLSLGSATQTGTVTFAGNAVAQGLTTFSSAYNIAFNGTTNTFTNDTTFLNTGTVTLGNGAGDTSTFTGGLDTTAASGTNIAGIVETTSTQMDLGATTMTAASTLRSGNTAINVASLAGGANVLTLGSATQTGTVTFAGNAVAQGLTTFASAYNIAFNGTTNAFTNDTTFLNTGTVTLGNGVGDTSTFTGGLDTTAASGTNIAGIVETTNTQMDLGATTMTAASTLRSGSGAINVASLAGGANVLTLGSATQTGTVTFAGNAVAQGLTTFASAYSIAFNGTTNTFTNDTTFLNTGTVTLGNGAGDTSTFTGGLDTTAASGTNIAGIVETTNTQMDLGATTMTAASTLRSGSGAINVASLAGGANVLTLGSATQTGTVTFAGNAVAQGLTTFSSAYNIAFNGTTNTFTNDTTFLNTGTVTLGNGAGDTSTFTGGLDTTAASGTNIAGIVETTSTQMDLGATTMTAASTLRSGNTAINVASLAGGANVLTLGSATQTGTVTFAGNAVAQGLTTFSSAYNIAFNGTTNAFTNDTTFLNTGTVTLGNDAGDTSTFTGGLDTTAASGTNIAGVVETTNTQMDLGATTMTTAATLRSGSGAINVASLAGGANVLSLGSATQTGTVTFAGNAVAQGLTTFSSAYNIAFNGTTNTFTNDTTFLNTGTVTLGNGVGDTSTFTGGLDTTAASGTNIAGIVETTNTQMDLGATTMTAASTLRSGSGAINVASLAGGANVLTLGSATQTGTVTFAGNAVAQGLTTFASAYSIAFNGTTNTFTNDTTFLNTGTVTLGNGAGDTSTFTGGLDTTAASGTNIAGIVETTNTQMDLGATTMTAASTLRSGSGAINVASLAGGANVLTLGSATQTGTVTFAGNAVAQGLTTFASAYNIAFNGTTNTFTNDTTFLNTGTVTLGNGAGDTSTFTGGLDTTAASGTNIAGIVETTNTQMDLGATTMTAASTLRSGSGAINVASLAGGANVLSLGSATQTGTVTFAGNAVAQGLTTFSSAYNIAFNGTTNTFTNDTTFLNTGTVTLGNGAGDTSTFTGGLDTTAASGTNIAGIVETTNTQMDLGATAMTTAATLRSGSGAINVASLAGGANVLTLGSLAQTGTVTFAGNAAAQGLTTFASAYNIAFNGTTNTFTNDTTFLNTGTVTLGNGAGDTSTFTGGLDTTAASGTNIAGIVETTNTQMDLGATTMTTAATLRSGSGAINVASLAGGANVLSLGSATQTGTVTFAGNAAAQGLTTFSSAYNIAFNGTTNTFTNDTTFLNTGTVTLGNGAGDTSTFTGGLDTTAASGTNIAGIVETTNTQMDLGATTMTAASTLRSGSGAINVASLAGGANVLTLGSATQTGTVTFAGNAVAQGLTTFSSAYNIAFNGTTNTFTNDTTFLNTGTVTLGNDAGDTSTFTGGLDTTAASGTNIAGIVETTNTQMDLGATTMTAASTLRSGSGAINVASLAGGANVLTLGSATQTGTVTFAGNAVAQGLTTFGSAYSIAFNGTTNTFTNDTTFLNTGTVTLGNGAGDTSTFTGGLDTTAASGTNIAGIVETTNTQMDLGATTMTTAATLRSGSGAINVASLAGGANVLTLGSATQTGTVTFAGNAVAQGLTTFSSAYNIAFNGTTNTFTNDTTFLNTGTVTLGNGAGDTSTFTGGLDTTAASGTNIAGIVETTNTQMDLGATTMTTAATLRSGSGAINVASLAGGANVLTLGSATQTGTVTFAGNAAAQGLTTFSSAYNIAFNGTTNTFTNDTTFLNTGTVTLGNGAGDTSTFTGGLDTTAASGTNIAGIVETTNTQMDLGATTMTAASTLRSGSGAINVASLAGGANVLTLGSATQTGTVTFAGNAVAQGLTTFASAYSIAFNGTTNTFTNDTTFLNTGTVTLGNGAGDTSTFTGGLDTTAASGTNIAGIVETTNTQMDLGATTMTAASTLRSGSGAINVASLAGGANVLTLGSATQTGTVTFAGNAVAQGLTTFSSAYNIAFNGTTNTFTNDTTFLNTGTVTLGNGAGDTSTFTGGLDTTAASGTNIAGIVETTNTQMDLGATTMTTAATLRSGSGAINVASLAGGANVLTLGSATQTGTVTFAGNAVAQGLTTFSSAYNIAFNGTTNTFTNDTTFLNTGTVTLGNGAGDTSTFTGGLDTTAASGTNIAGIVETTNTQMDLGATTMSAASTLRSGSGAINVASLAGGANVLTLGSLAQTGTVTFAGNAVAQGLTTFSSAYNIAFNGTTNTFTNDTTFLNTGTVTLGNGAGDTSTFTGGLDTTAASGTNIAGIVETTSTQMDLGATTMTAASTLRSGNTAINVASLAGGANVLTLGSATQTGTVTFAGNAVAQGLTTFASAYNIAFNGTTNAFTNDTTFLNTGTVTLGNGAGDTSTFTGGLDTTAASGTNIAGIVETTNTQMDLGATTMTAASTLRSGSGAINVASLAGGANVLTLGSATQTGTVTFAGNAAAQGLTTFSSAYNIAFNGTTNTFTNDTTFLNTGTVTLGNGAGDTSTFTGGLDTTAASGTNIAGIVETTNTQMDLGATTMTTAATLRSGSGAINVASLAGGANVLTLGSLAQTGTVTFAGNAAAQGLTTFSSAYNIAFNGTTNTFTNDTTFLNTGTVTLGNGAGDTSTFTGGLDTTAASGTNIAGIVETTNTQMDLGATTMSAASTLRSGSGAINVASLAGGANVLTLGSAAQTGTVTFAGNAVAQGLTTFSSAYNIAFNGTTNTFTNDTTFLNTGTVTLGNGAGDTSTFTGGLDTTAASGTNIAGIVETTNTQMDLGATTMTTAATLRSGSGAINVASLAGGANVLSLGSATQTGTVTFAGNAVAQGLTTFSSAYNIAFNGTTNAFTNDTTFLNTGTVTLGNGAGDTSTFTGGLDTTAASGTNIAGIVETTNTQMDLGATTMTAASTLRSGSGAINVASLAGGANVLTLGSATQTGTVTFAGNAVAQGLTTFSSAYNIAFNGTTNTFTNDTTFLNTGTVTLGNGAGDTSTFTGGLDTTAASGTNIAGIVETTNTQMDLGATTMTAASTLRSGSGAINVASLAGGANVLTLGSLAQTGTVTFAGNAVAQGLTTFGSNYAITMIGAANTFVLNVVFLNTGLVTLGNGGDTFAFGGGMVFTGNAASNVAATITSSGDVMNFGTGGVTLTGNSSVATTTGSSAGADITFGSTVAVTADDAQSLTVNAGTGGVITFGGDVGTPSLRLSTLTVTALTVNYGGDVYVAGDMDFGNVVLTGDRTFSTGGTATFGTVDGTVANFDLSIVAADLDLTGLITNIGILTIENIAAAGNITLMGTGGLALSQAEWNFIQPSVDFVVLGNTTTNVGAVTVAAAWINNSAVTVDFLSGGAGEFNIDGTITGTGSLTVNGSGNSTNINADATQGFFNILDSVVVEGGVTRTLTATGALGIVIDSTGFANGISANAAATNLALLTTFATAPISVTGTFTALGGSGLTNLTMGGNGVNAGTITLAASGTILGALSADNASGIDLNSNAGTLTAGSMFFGENTTLTANTNLVTTLADIEFGTGLATATLNGAAGLELTAAGNILFSGAVGNTSPLFAILINDANNVTASSITALSLTQLAGSGTTTLNGAVVATGVGVNVVTDTIALNNTINTTVDGGIVTLNADTGALTISVAGVITSGGVVDLTGVAGISTAGDITTTGDVVNFNSATTMDGSIAVNTGAGAGDINFASTLDLFFYNLTLTAGTGSVAFIGAVGDAPGNAIGTITINSAFNVTAAAIQAASFRQLAGTGATTFNGAQTYSALAGLNVVTSGTIALNNTVTTIPPTGGNSGNVTLNGAAGLTIGAAGDITSDGAVNLTGGGTGIHTAGDITTTAAVVNFNSATTLDGVVSIDTTNGGSEIGAAILFAGALNGSQALTLTAGAGTISFGGLVGDSQALASLTVVSARDISIGNAMKVTGAVSITGNSGVDIFLGTADVGGLSLTDAELDFITEAGSLAITATGAGASITVNGVTGGGVVSGVTTLASNADGVFFMTTASTFNNSLAVVANDVAVDALLGVTGSISFTANSGVNVIVGTGGVSTNLILSNAELALLTASSGLNVTATGAGATLNINGVTGGGNITGTTTLSSLQSTITFLNNASTFNNSLALVANNVDVTVALGVTGSISFTGNSGVDVFLGVSGPGLNLTNVELALLTASGGMNVTATGAGSSMTVNGVTGGGAITGTTTLSSVADGVTFATTASNFNNALAVVGITTIAGVNITTSSDSITFSGQVSLTTAGVSINTVSGDITFADALNGRQALTLTAGAGSITFTGAVGDTITLASLTVVSAGDISIGNTMKVNGALSITANTGVDIFLGTAGAGLSLTDAELDFITEAGSLEITATGTGAAITVNGVTGGGDVHGATLLTSNVDGVFFMTTASTFNNSLAVVANDVAIDAALDVTGIISFTGNSGVNVIVGTGGLSTDLILSNAELARLTASGGMNVTATGAGSTLNVNGVTGGGNITGTTTLTGSNGVTFTGASSSFDSALTIASIATIDSVGVTSTAGGIQFSNSVTLTGNGTSTITSRGIAGDIINVVGPIVATGDNSEALIVNAGLGEISFSGDIGSSTDRLSALTLTAANTSFAGDVFVFGDLNVGNVSLTGPTTFETNGLLTVGSIVGVGFALDLVANALNITNSITSVSVLTIRNIALDGDISIGGIATFDISQGEWDLIQSSVNSVVLGSLVNTGAITVAGPWINNRAVTVDFLSGDAGEFNINGNVTGSGSLTVHGSGHSTNINADMTQASFNILDSVVVGGGAGTRTLTATAVGGIVINSTGFIDGISADAAATNLALLTTFATAPISVTGTFTAVGGSALTNLTMSGNGGVDAGTITLVASGTILGAILADVAAGINLNSNAGTLTAASMFFGEDTTLTGATILAATAGDINFGTDPATATLGGAFGITLTASGNATFTDLITLTGAAGSFAFTGINLTLNGVGTNAIATTMTVTNTGLFTTYNGGLAPTGADLVVGSDFVQNGIGLNSIGGNITSTNDGISFATGVTLTNNVTMTSGLLAGDDISFATAIRSDVSTTRDLTLTAGLGDIALNDGTSTTTLLDAILINSARNVVVGDAITATSFIQLAGTGSTTFAGTLLLTGALTVNAGTSVGNTITFASTVGSVTASSVNLNTLASSARATPATVATIVSGGNIAFSSGTFDMGLNHKLTGLGNITIGGLLPATNATTVTLGDVNAVGNLSVNSAVINLRARASGPIVTNTGGTITDPMVDYIVGGRVFFSVAPVMVGSGGRAVFANTSGNVDANGTLGGFVTSIYQSPITVALLTGAGGQILDLSVANFLAQFNPANIIPPQMSILPPIGVLGSSEELEQNEKKKAKPETQGSKKTASETPKTAPGIPVALR